MTAKLNDSTRTPKPTGKAPAAPPPAPARPPYQEPTKR